MGARKPNPVSSAMLELGNRVNADWNRRHPNSPKGGRIKKPSGIQTRPITPEIAKKQVERAKLDRQIGSLKELDDSLIRKSLQAAASPHTYTPAKPLEPASPPASVIADKAAEKAAQKVLQQLQAQQQAAMRKGSPKGGTPSSMSYYGNRYRAPGRTYWYYRR